MSFPEECWFLKRKVYRLNKSYLSAILRCTQVSGARVWPSLLPALRVLQGEAREQFQLTPLILITIGFLFLREVSAALIATSVIATIWLQ